MRRLFMYFLVFLVGFYTPSSFAEQPTLVSQLEVRNRRTAINQELDRNIEAVRQCFELLDATPASDKATRNFMDAQIQQYEDRSSVLHDELEQIDRHEFLVERKANLLEKAAQLEKEAKQLVKVGQAAAAQQRNGQAAAIRKSLEDGSWKVLAHDEWSAEATLTPDLVSVLQLNAEVETLKMETKKLRAEVQDLRDVIQRMEAKLQAIDTMDAK